MFNILCDDLLLLILFNLNCVKDVINLASINKTNFDMINNNSYIDWGRNKYSNEFWDKAKKRTISVSKPLVNMKMELLRIYNFENHQIKHGLEMWTNADFYNYWNNMEDYIITKKKLSTKIEQPPLNHNNNRHNGGYILYGQYPCYGSISQYIEEIFMAVRIM